MLNEFMSYTFDLMIPGQPDIFHKRPDQALRSLKWLRGMGLETEDEFVSMKQGMEDRREEEEEDVYSFLLSAAALKPLGICTLLMVFQQFSGINAVMFYSVSIFVASGSPSPHASTIILGIVNIAATIISNLLIDRLGRKVARMQNVKSRPQRDLTVAWQVLLQLSCVGMIVSLGLLGFHYHSDETSPATPLVALMVNLSSLHLRFQNHLPGLHRQLLPWLWPHPLASDGRTAAFKSSRTLRCFRHWVKNQTYMNYKLTQITTPVSISGPIGRQLFW